MIVAPKYPHTLELLDSTSHRAEGRLTRKASPSSEQNLRFLEMPNYRYTKSHPELQGATLDSAEGI
jgi:hypothetical protein